MPKDIDSRMVFGISPDGTGDGVPLMLLGVTKGSWDYIKDGKTVSIDLTKIGINLKIVSYGCESYDKGRKLIENYMAKTGQIMNDLTREDFTLEQSSEPITSFRESYRFLSNFHYKEVSFEGHKYPTVENAYQAAKTLDETIRVGFMDISPNKAKQRSRKLQIRDDWEKIKIEVMEDLVLQKFSSEPEKKMLLDTGDRELIEGNIWGDQFWGQCPIGKGENHLGKILMKVRTYLRGQE